MSFWSKLFKSTKDPDSNNKGSANPATKLSEEEKSKIESEIKQLNDQIKSEKNADSESDDFSKKKAEVLTQLGKDYQRIGNIDEAINAYETSLKCNEDFGPAFDGLLTLYDEKRKQASYAKDNDEIQKWLNKSDSLTALSKKIMRSK
ncbi:tetratricopeptide repeat protein [Lactobacillus sp. ESL0791]|uniref:tetratricopeptide repeat protein n=1 Tax=Lactobacillus sp. ESL0791 TaxID=2983234 RepID=UPI0023F904C4|nr:tetratricopeptide repeat protein [Lactobacillus sp. ESL0791]MDF7639493.1 tetratricopeptide repeat protein [Lactobacillus sp. ESL0791]